MRAVSLLGCAGMAWLSTSAVAEVPINFESDVWPIIEHRCVECHGPDAQKGALRLDSVAGFQHGSEFGEILVAGDAAKSELIERLTLPPDEDGRMPSKGDPLDPDQIELIRAWIEQGAGFGDWNPTPAEPKLIQRDLSYLPTQAEMPKRSISFNKDIRQILSNNCFRCHGPDEAARKADLRLDLRDEAVKAHDGIAAIVPGKLAESAVVAHIFSDDENDRMPPPDSGKSLSREEQVLLAAWIAQGAEYEAHWSYITPTRPTLPDVVQEAWIENPIDRFVLAELERQGIEPAARAHARTLARRVYLDTIGLPPEPRVVDRFAANPTTAEYGRLVDELLESPHFGERMAINWLDQVRYADTNGYHSDESRSVTPYRDYVIDAFNRNLPYDQFTIEQLAGDLLPKPTTEQLIASGFNRMNQLTAEGGAQPAEYRAKYAADRVRAVGSVWLGATLGCAECHDHKFDPITTKEFYQVAAFFSDIEERAVYVTGETWDPRLPLPTPGEKQQLAALDTEIAALDRVLSEHTPALAESQAAWEAEILAGAADLAEAWQPSYPVDVVSEGGATMLILDDASVVATGENPRRETYVVTLATSRANITGVRVEAMNHWTLGRGISRAGTAPFILSEIDVTRFTPGDHGPQPVAISDAKEDRRFLLGGAADAIDGQLSSGWYNVSQKSSGDRTFAVYRFAEPIVGGPGTEITVRLRSFGLNPRTSIGRFRLALTSMAEPDVSKEIGVPEQVLETLAIPREERSDAEQDRIARYYRTVAPELADARARWTEAHDEKIRLQDNLLTTFVTRPTEPRMTRVLPRGEWLREDGDVVEPATPATFPPMNVDGRRANRLDLATWLVNPDHPTTARVFVNRLWKQYFGTGISRVLDDFGSQGEWPTHPELLDWLAVEFIDSGWDVKHIARLMLTSTTYQQASATRHDLDAIDPKNRLLARQTPLRLDAELIRDNALAVSGLLNPTLGGATVKPYQPSGYWANANTFGGESLAYVPSPGADQYRRGLYTYWKRSFLHPSLLAFDAPSREECTAERPVSNTPLQALVLLNDPTYVEAAGAFAERIIREGGAHPSDRIAWAFREALARKPSDAESLVLVQLQRDHRAKFVADADAANAIIDVGLRPVAEDLDRAEWASWISVARTILNLPETITRL